MTRNGSCGRIGRRAPIIFHVVFNIGQAIPQGRHEVVLRAFANGVASRFWRFVVVLSAQGELMSGRSESRASTKIVAQHGARTCSATDSG